MGKDRSTLGPAILPTQQPALRFLIESALRRVKSTKETDQPQGRDDWVVHLTEALMSSSETSHKAVLATLLSNGVRSDELYDYYIPAAARYLGELWVMDRASFVDVTVGSSRLQALFRNRFDGGAAVGQDRLIPLGQSVLMAIPDYEDHSLGAFAAADQLRRHGLWVHMGVGLKDYEIASLLESGRFSMVGISAATWNTLEKVTELVDYLRVNLECVPPIVLGGRVVSDPAKVEQRTGVDFAVKTVREAVEKCGLATVGTSLALEALR